LAVHVGTPVAPRPQGPDEGLLHAERPRAPEPVGIPSPQVVADGEEVLRRAAYRGVVDVPAGVVAPPGRDIAEGPDGQVELTGAERDAIEEIRAVTLVAPLAHDLLDGRHAGGR